MTQRITKEQKSLCRELWSEGRPVAYEGERPRGKHTLRQISELSGVKSIYTVHAIVKGRI